MPPTSSLVRLLGEVRATEELNRIAILVAALTEMDLPEVGRELCLLEAAATDILVRCDDLAPRLQRLCCGRLNQRAADATRRIASLLIDD